jgi:hypothetical protein
VLIRRQLIGLLGVIALSLLPAVSSAQDIRPLEERASPTRPVENGLPDDPYTVHNGDDSGFLDVKGRRVHQTDKSPRILTTTFVTVHAIYLGAAVYDTEMTHQGLAHHRCVEANINPPFPSRGDLYKHNLIQVAIFTAMDVGLKAYGNSLGISPRVSDFVSSVGAFIGTGRHIYGGTQWATECW